MIIKSAIFLLIVTLSTIPLNFLILRIAHEFKMQTMLLKTLSPLLALLVACVTALLAIRMFINQEK
ncbi:hypothetical protein XMM312_002283 [Marinobacterium sp. xm-m-312]|nr:hypothetical protein [Marinobacterium sp. xm-m-312]